MGKPISMNFVYNSINTYTLITFKHIKYVWGDVDIRDYLSEETIQNIDDIIIVANGGAIRVLKHDKIPVNRKYQVVSEFTRSSQIKYKNVIICPEHMQWNLSEMMSEGDFEAGEKYIEIDGENINEMELLNLASNLSYMYGIRFTPHTVIDNKSYRISSDRDTAGVWNDIIEHLSDIKRVYKLSSIGINSKKRKSKVNENLVKAKDFGWEW